MASENRAAFVPSAGAELEVRTSDIHQPESGELLVRVHAVAIQPLDAKKLLSGYGGAGTATYPAVFGTSGAGVVEQVGSDVVGFQAGDHVVFDTKAYVDNDVNVRQGTWQQLTICSSKTAAKIGDVDFEQAVLVDFPLQTAVAALHHFLGMGKPGTASPSEKVLVWGAGGAVGSYAVQYAKSVGHTVVVTASARDTARQQSLGASEVIDYKSPDAVERLRALGPFKYLITGSGDAASQQALASLLQPSGGRFASVLGGDVELPANVERVYTGFSQAAQSEEHAAWRDWWYGEYLPKVLSEKLVEPVKFTKVEGGLAALQGASRDVFEGKVRGKLVVNPQE
ncbi:oxidoreductase domain-containing protein [Aaosphaeria arxii CBS 175.79]|uniref:Oxidoreductase domain-containing protein n=1 Tax=Aaosphaeria arxii CBS 175.79 TaxID=1450172 RepID=A0A6A5XD45_9PLEO|nr:oxidoreductase domain-containing protein [Aaosphaeria arxii CBS 175.79]KAF2010820.1 oxidoreductase domain-containing protein [Aaosphaeria arxii CBS 175.79]